MTVNAIDTVNASQNPTPVRSIAGSTRNMGMDGRKNQNALCDSSATRCESPVSRHTHRNVSKDTSGSDTINPPIPGHRLAISDAAAISAPEIAAFSKR